VYREDVDTGKVVEDYAGYEHYYNNEKREDNMAKHKITDWTITAVVERPDGTWYDHTITDFPEHIGITINEWLQDYKTTEEESNEEEKI